MPKTKGMTSIEIAIIVAIVLVIAVAVGWYLYTTFTASTQAQATLSVVSAVYSTTASPPVLRVTVSNPGPVDVIVQTVQLAGVTCTPSGFTLPYRITVGRIVTLNMTCTGITATPGTMLQGVVVTTAGTSFPFTAIVR